MTRCDDCGLEAKSAAGLSAHRRAKHAGTATASGSNRAALEVTLAELTRMGRLERVDEARVAALRSMSVALDRNPFNSQMWREYRASLSEVTKANDDADDGLADALAQIRGAPEVGDSASS